MSGHFFRIWVCECGARVEAPAFDIRLSYGQRLCPKCGERLKHTTKAYRVRYESTGFWPWQRQIVPHPDDFDELFERVFWPPKHAAKGED